jgi:Flp pilus assembly protein TadD
LGLVGAAALALALRGRRDLAGGLLLVLLLSISVAVGDPSAAWTPSLLLVPALGLGLLAVRARADFGPALWLFPATMMTFSALQAPAYRSPVAQTVAIAAASPASPGARAAAARALIDAGRLEEAEAAIAALEADLGRSPDLFAVQGHLLHVRGKDGAAIPLLESALGGDPNQIEAAIELVGILRARGDLEGARFHAGRLAELHPDRPEGAALLAELGGP